MTTQSSQFYTPWQNGNLVLDRLTVLAFLWACQGLFHMQTFWDWVRVPYILGFVLVALLVVIFLRPYSTVLFAAGLAVNIAYSIFRMPYNVNHLLMEDLINLTILVSIVWVFIQHRRQGKTTGLWLNAEGRNQAFQMFLPVVRVLLLLLYFFATLHKLNVDYFNSSVSCGVEMVEAIFNHHPILGFATPLLQFSHLNMWLSLLFEAGIPLLLLFRPTRVFGIIVALLFHLVLGFYPNHAVYSFTSMVYMLLYLYTDDQFTATLSRLLTTAAQKLQLGRYLRRYLAGILVLLGLLGSLGAFVYITQGVSALLDSELTFIIWLSWAVTIMLVYFIAFWQTPAYPRPAQERLLPNRGLLWVFPVIVLFNGFNPYLGLKTHTAFSMFSNLRTEQGYENHYFMPNIVLADYQQDLVEIIESDHPRFQTYASTADTPILLTRFEFERLLSETPGDFTVTCDCEGNGEMQTITKRDGMLEGTTIEDYSFLAGRFLIFRPITKGDVQMCVH